MNNNNLQINNLFLLGAGFTRAIFPNAPLNKDLLPVLCTGTPRITLTKYHRIYKTDDIEILLTQLDMRIPLSPHGEQTALKTVRRDIEQQLAEYFRQFRFTEGRLKANNWLETLAKKLFKDNYAIITTNYDCFLEGLLDFYNVWYPREGYVNVYDPSIPTRFPERVLRNPKGIKFYKIHGSENFRECKQFDDKGETEKTIIGFIIDENIYPVSGKNRNLGWVKKYSKEYIIAPSFVKVPHFQIADMLNKAIDAAKTAKNMVIIGSGLRDEDIFLRSILTSFITHGLQNKKKLITVDPNADLILEKIEKFWIGGTQNITFHKISKNIEDGLFDLIKQLEDV